VGVTDPSKAAIPHATVVVTDTATNVSVTVLTSEQGDYVVTPLNPGVYKVTVTLDGFQTAIVESVAVQVGQSTRGDVQLKIGSLSETTIVGIAAPLLDSESDPATKFAPVSNTHWARESAAGPSNATENHGAGRPTAPTAPESL